MRGFFNLIRWFFSLFFCLILAVIILAGLTATSISSTITKPGSVKTWLSQGEIYNNAPTIIAAMINSQGNQKDSAEMPISEEQLVQISSAVLEPTWLKKNLEKIIDSTYVWLRGGSQIPDFEINISDRKEIMVNEISSQLQMGSQMSREIETEIEKNELLKQDKIKSAELIKINPQETEKIQTAYQHIEKLPLYSLALFLSISLILFFLVPKLSNKFFVLGLVWLVPSLILAISTPIIKNIVPTFLSSKLQTAKVSNPQLILEIINKPINLALKDITSKILIYGIILIISGGILLVASYKTKPAPQNAGN